MLCAEIVAGNPTRWRIDSGDIAADDDLLADDDVAAGGNVIAGGYVRADGNVKAGGNVTVGNFAFDDRVPVLPFSLWRNSDIEGSIMAAGNVYVGSPNEEVITSPFGTERPAWYAPGGNVLARGSVIAQTDLGAKQCACGGVVTRRAVADAFEVPSDSRNQPPTSMAEWGDRNRSAAYEAFRQLRVRFDGDAQLALAPAEVHKVFPSAVKTFTPHNKDEKPEGPAAAEMTIDLTQLVYTQLAVMQGLIKANDELRKANDALRGRVTRLEKGR
ncbi:unnamed protein product [Vitrella brassicaformis CCMP3155]|uniref:Uncharacterized protein n=2 Tax=Vitrella brassicaformis TaxID=1169539 RepID=A0A0G4GJP2_VITBC|nr:unnamed protein product [Vitrella brassicaformis CCMP3155]|eukprot:CEM30141.1 unnamed protein product [Vitrella brassicaformis CCMP3155]